MNHIEAVQMMNRCKQEILRLRAVIAHLEPKAEAYDDNMALVLRLLPRSSIDKTDDVIWLLDKRIRELELKMERTDA
jgi:hypothetical protein